MGPASALYGANALVGVINVVTKLNDSTLTNGGHLEQTAGWWSTLSTGLVLQRTVSDLAFYGAVNYLQTANENLGDWLTSHADQYRSRRQPWTAPGDNPNFAYRNQARSVMVEAQVEYRGFYAGALVLNNYAEGGIEEVRPTFGERTLRREELLWYLGMRRQLGSVLNLRLEYIDETENISDVWTFAAPGIVQPIPPGMHFDPKGLGGQQGFFGMDGARKHRAETQLDFTPLPSTVLTAGGSVERWDLGTGPLCCTAPNLLPASDQDLALISNDELLRYWRAGAFLQAKQSLWGMLHFTAGVRLDARYAPGGALNRNIVNPRLGLVLQPWPGASLRLLYGQAYREPNVFELQSTPGLSPSTMKTFEVAYAQRVGPVLLQTSGYVNQLADAILANPFASQRDQPGYISAPARSMGLEASFQLRTDRWQAFGFYSFVRREPFEDAVNRLRADTIGVSPHKAVLGASVDLFGRLFVSAYDVWNSAADDVAATVAGDAVQILRVPAYNDVNATLGLRGVQVGDMRLDASLNVDNALDRDNLRPNIRGSDPRAFIQNHLSAMLKVRLQM
jgi:outer membrane receptor protein involved in Fe transport